MDPLELLRSRNRFEETLPSGLNVTLRRPRMRDCILAGGVPLPVLAHLSKQVQSNGDAPTVSNEDAAHMARFQDEIVRRSLVAIDGEPVEVTAEDLFSELAQEDYDRIVELATRAVPTDAVSPDVREIAAFASSEQGKAFARIEQHFGRDPARFLEGRAGMTCWPTTYGQPCS